MNYISIGTGKCSSFGGSSDTGVGLLEGLGLIENSDLEEWWFRRLFVTPGQWDNGKGLARNLDMMAFYCAMRFHYGSDRGVPGEILVGYTREQIRRGIFLIRSKSSFCFSQAADWGPAKDTGRIIDMSPGCCKHLGVQTDDQVLVEFIPPQLWLA